MSQHPPYMSRHAKPDGDEAYQPPRRLNPDTEARLLGHGGSPGWLAFIKQQHVLFYFP